MDPPFKKLAKRARRRFRGYPIATVPFYGPTNEFASKVVASIVEGSDWGPTVLERWLGTGPDVRHDEGIGAMVEKFIRDHGARSLVMSRGIIGCPHEEGVDYPRGAARAFGGDIRETGY